MKIDYRQHSSKNSLGWKINCLVEKHYSQALNAELEWEDLNELISSSIDRNNMLIYLCPWLVQKCAHHTIWKKIHVNLKEYSYHCTSINVVAQDYMYLWKYTNKDYCLKNYLVIFN